MQKMEEKGSSSCGVLCYIGSNREIERVPPGSRGALGCWFTMEPGPSTTVYNGMTWPPQCDPHTSNWGFTPRAESLGQTQSSQVPQFTFIWLTKWWAKAIHSISLDGMICMEVHSQSMLSNGSAFDCIFLIFSENLGNDRQRIYLGPFKAIETPKRANHDYEGQKSHPHFYHSPLPSPAGECTKHAIFSSLFRVNEV